MFRQLCFAADTQVPIRYLVFCFLLLLPSKLITLVISETKRQIRHFLQSNSSAKTQFPSFVLSYTTNYSVVDKSFFPGESSDKPIPSFLYLRRSRQVLEQWELLWWGYSFAIAYSRLNRKDPIPKKICRKYAYTKRGAVLGQVY